MSQIGLERRHGGTRDAAIVRATLRELLPLWLGTLAIGFVVEMATLETRDVPGSPNTWPLVVLPIAGLWGGLSISGGSRTSLTYLLARPVSRVRVLAWRWVLLLAGLGLVALPLWWTGQHVVGGGPGLWTIVSTTLLASAFGAQGSALSDREPMALSAAVMLGAAFVLPVQVALQSQHLSWTRVDEALGWSWLAPVAGGFLLLASPVAWTWARVLPARGREAGVRVVLASLAASLSFVAVAAWPMVRWVGAPVRGQLLAVVAATHEGPIVATGTRGEEGKRDIVDGLVVIDGDGNRRTIWDRHAAAPPNTTVWRFDVPEIKESSAHDDTIVIGLVDGPEPDSLHSVYDVILEVDIVAERRNPAALHGLDLTWYGEGSWGAAYGSVRGTVLGARNNVLYVVDLENEEFRELQRIRASEIRPSLVGGFAAAHGRVWAVIEAGRLWSAPLPWTVQR